MRVFRLENADQEGPYWGGHARDAGNVNLYHPVLRPAPGVYVPSECCSGFRSIHQLDTWFPLSARTALAKYGYKVLEFEVSDKRVRPAHGRQLLFVREGAKIVQELDPHGLLPLRLNEEGQTDDEQPNRRTAKDRSPTANRWPKANSGRETSAPPAKNRNLSDGGFRRTEILGEWQTRDSPSLASVVTRYLAIAPEDW